jgi:flagellar basal body rod protein FlgG
MTDISTQVNNSLNNLKNEFNVITHNLANVSTAGYKRRFNIFAKVLKQQVGYEGNISGSQGSRSKSAIDFSQGSLTRTGRSLDLALFGKGFFTLETPNGQLYTRKGMFHINENKQLVDDENRIVAGQSGAIAVPQNVSPAEIHISEDGTLRANDIQIGKLKLADFEDNQDKLIPAGKGCFYMTDSRIEPELPEKTIVKQGSLEGSNVEMIEELVDMIMVNRTYEANMKILSATRDASGSLMSVAMG